ncbi:MAG TPA: hypothetical protein VMU94_25440, partial [Streptosporangiaceae bacterium]|nr:hypothetical protein [Streptosporangiaceae bacterium]
PGARCPVPGARCPVPGARCPVPGARCPAPPKPTAAGDALARARIWDQGVVAAAADRATLLAPPDCSEDNEER